jgi:hypothetical protein
MLAGKTSARRFRANRRFAVGRLRLMPQTEVPGQSAVAGATWDFFWLETLLARLLRKPNLSGSDNSGFALRKNHPAEALPGDSDGRTALAVQVFLQLV